MILFPIWIILIKIISFINLKTYDLKSFSQSPNTIIKNFHFQNIEQRKCLFIFKHTFELGLADLKKEYKQPRGKSMIVDYFIDLR